ncbi:hypothetical protein JOE21_003400 [Desmospora profundinema]|uniref:Uncharacterized protein n=1 Tax=Desmospora profundinema TaxID=1571184 RepID=A0ABU1IRK9_9BACL|nr:hypothetical protein [Desmospora profundinema]
MKPGNHPIRTYETGREMVPIPAVPVARRDKEWAVQTAIGSATPPPLYRRGCFILTGRDGCAENQSRSIRAGDGWERCL